MTWNDVRAEARRRFPSARDEAGRVNISLRFSGAPSDPDVDQSLTITPLESGGDRWLCIVALVCGRSELAPDLALEHNANLLVGALCLQGSNCLLRLVTPMAAASEASLARDMKLVAHEAARLRALRILARRSSTPALQHFAE
jgi:hypothetical protein